ncbi:site-specific DNA-methyltransferase [Candidatus Poribacteria bacterium]|nr:site-specific DNA-methyltransferase [Candidatus Poribacteria bacterium]
MKTNCIIENDNLKALRDLPDRSIDLIYADPPFNTGRDFVSEDGGYTDKPGIDNQAPMLDPTIDFSWLQDVCTPNQRAYFAMMIPRLLEIERILKPTGAFYYHCDWRTSAHIRLILNQIFGQNRFRNEIAWMYQISMPFDTIKNIWKNNYDAILFYAGKDHAFKPQHHPLTYQQIKEMYPYTDSHGRKYRYKNGLYAERQYADENKGTRIGTAWDDISIATPKERVGYPTQKPLGLLKRIIEASSNEDDIVLAPYCGSGTTCVAAQQLGRRYIGIDQNSEAIHIAQRRLS